MLKMTVADSVEASSHMFSQRKCSLREPTHISRYVPQGRSPCKRPQGDSRFVDASFYGDAALGAVDVQACGRSSPVRLARFSPGLAKAFQVGQGARSPPAAWRQHVPREPDGVPSSGSVLWPKKEGQTVTLERLWVLLGGSKECKAVLGDRGRAV